VFDKMSLWWFFGVLALFGESLDAIPQLLKLLPESLLPKTPVKLLLDFCIQKMIAKC
jgi:hypothetical protein